MAKGDGQGVGGGKKPRVLNKDEITSVKKLAGVLTIHQLSEFLEMSHDTFTRICERQPEVMRTYKKARANIVGKVAYSLVQDAIEGDIASRIFYLKTQAGWSESKKDDPIADSSNTVISFNVKEAKSEVIVTRGE